MEQTWIKIGDIDVPIIVDNDAEWFPVSYITTKVLLRSGKNALVNKRNKEMISNHLQKFIIKYDGVTNLQESKCISRDGLINVLIKTRVGRLSVEQRQQQNKLHEYLDIELLPTEEQDSLNYKKVWFNEVDDYTKEIIKNELKNGNPNWIRMCSKCNKHYPLTNRFFPVDNRAEKGFCKTCRVCLGSYKHFTHQDENKNYLRRKQIDLCGSMNDDQIMEIYFAYRNKVIKRLPKCYENKESYQRIIKKLFNEGTLNVNNLTYGYIKEDCRLSGVVRYLDIVEIYEMLFGYDFYLYVWKYPRFSFNKIKLTYDVGIQIVKNYLKEHNVVIDNVFEYDYEQLFKNCRITSLTNRDNLGFIVRFYDYKYAGYLFNTYAVNYYKNEDNLLFDLKYLVEQDMKIDVYKIPLYLTKHTLHKKSSSLYNYVISKNNGSLYYWLDKLYPNQFTLHDFEMNGYRNEFDSDTEMYIHEILTENFINVIYNQKHTDRTLRLNDMIPDWFVITENGVWIIEYFGLYEERQYGKSTRVTDYIDKTKVKIDRYKEMNGYKFIFLYPKDIEDDFKGCREIIAKMRENPYMSMV